MFKNSLSDIFSVLKNIYNTEELILVGSEIESWLKISEENKLQKICYINQSQQNYNFDKLPQNWSLSSKLLATEDGKTSFYKLSNPQLNGTVSSDMLSKFWQNLTTLEVSTLPAATLKTIMTQECSRVTSKILVLDTFDGVVVLDQLENLDLNVIAIRTIVDENSELHCEHAVVEQRMATYNYRKIANYQDNHPKIQTVIYVQDLLKNQKELQKVLETEVQEAQMSKLALENQTNEFMSQINEEKQKNVQVLKEKEEIFKQKKEIRKTLETKIQEIQNTKQALESKTKELQKKQEEEKKIKEIFQKEKDAILMQLNAHDLELTRIKNELEIEKNNSSRLVKENEEHLKNITRLKEHITKSSANVIKQLESYMGLKSYIKKPLNYHGWPISPDIALFMAQKIEENDYDLIIEFGSGTSTILFANIVKNIKKKKGKKIKVVSFEHNEKYHTQTKQRLKQQDLNKYALVNYTPLKKYIYQDLEFMYYDCAKWLQKIKDKNKYKNILVLVDGPPGATGPMARFPAMPHILDQFTQNSIDLILDDFHRKEEKLIVEKWEKLLQEKSITYHSESIPSEKGLYFCQIINI